MRVISKANGSKRSKATGVRKRVGETVATVLRQIPRANGERRAYQRKEMGAGDAKYSKMHPIREEMGCGELSKGGPGMAEREGRPETGIEDEGIDALVGDEGRENRRT